MKKEIIVILLIFSLFLTISSVSAMESIHYDDEDYSDFELIDNENFNGDGIEGIGYSLEDDSESNFADSIEEESFIDDEYPIDDTDDEEENPLLDSEIFIDNTEDDDLILYNEDNYLKLGSQLRANNRGTSIYI